MSEGVEAHIRKKIAQRIKEYREREDLAQGEKEQTIHELEVVRNLVLAVLAEHQPKTRIRILNDTSTQLTIRRPPTSHKIQPQKMMLEFVEGNEVFLKVWDGNVILLSKDGVGGAEP